MDTILKIKARSRFTKDFALPIPVKEDPYFDYYIDAFDKSFHTKTKYALFMDAVNQLGGYGAFLNTAHQIHNDIINAIKESDAFEKFNKIELDAYPFEGTIWNKKNAVYRPENADKVFISIDLKKANYNVMKWIDPKLVLNSESYPDLVKHVTDIEYFAQSKQIRQIIFGNVNPKRQRHFMKHVMYKIYQEIPDTLLEHVSLSTPDEIIIECAMNLHDAKVEFSKLYYWYEKMDEIFPFMNFTMFRLKTLETKSHKKYYVKEDLYDGSVQFKTIPKTLIAQCIKKYENKPINDNDLLFIYDKKLCKYMEPIF